SHERSAAALLMRWISKSLVVKASTVFRVFTVGCLLQPVLFTKASTTTADSKIRAHCGILSSRQDHTKGARPRKRGDDAPAGGRARRSVGQHTISSMPPFLVGSAQKPASPTLTRGPGPL